MDTGGGSDGHDCNVSGCCDLFVSCNADGTCSVPAAECHDHAGCSAGEACAGGVCEVVDPTVSISGTNDLDAPYLGVLSCEHAPTVFLVGDRYTWSTVAHENHGLLP